MEPLIKRLPGCNTTTARGNTKYKLVSDLLMVDKDFYKILVPPSMVGLLLAHTHLLGHKGLTRMLSDLQSYWFPTMNTLVKKLCQHLLRLFP